MEEQSQKVLLLVFINADLVPVSDATLALVAACLDILFEEVGERRPGLVLPSNRACKDTF